jgi:hypothetical protein
MAALKAVLLLPVPYGFWTRAHWEFELQLANRIAVAGQCGEPTLDQLVILVDTPVSAERANCRRKPSKDSVDWFGTVIPIDIISLSASDDSMTR